MAAGDINDAASQIPGIALADDSGDPTDLGAGYALLKFKNGLPVWLPNGGTVRTALARGATSQLSTLTEEAAPVDADLFLMERASDGALRKVQAQNLPGGGNGGGLYQSYAHYAHTEAQNTNGGATTTGAWNTIPLTSEVADPDGIGTLSGNAVTVGAGSYRFQGAHSFYQAGTVQIRLYDVTHSTSLGDGPIARAASNGEEGVVAPAVGRFTVAEATQVRLEYQCTYANSGGWGLGAAGNWGTEHYGDLELWKEA